jgi:serine/threonine-protein kinase RsbW
VHEKVVGVTAVYRPLLGQSLASPRERAARVAGEAPIVSRLGPARVFAGTAEQVPLARRFVADALAGCPAGAQDALLLCVTELCANAIEHTASGAGGVFLVEVSRPGDGVACVAVTDGGSARVPRPLPLQPGPDELADAADLAEGGRGLALVAAFSSSWGYQGRTAWAEVTWPVPVTASSVPKQAAVPYQETVPDQETVPYQETWEDLDARAPSGGPAA